MESINCRRKLTQVGHPPLLRGKYTFARQLPSIRLRVPQTKKIRPEASLRAGFTCDGEIYCAAFSAASAAFACSTRRVNPAAS